MGRPKAEGIYKAIAAYRALNEVERLAFEIALKLLGQKQQAPEAPKRERRKDAQAGLPPAAIAG